MIGQEVMVLTCQERFRLGIRRHFFQKGWLGIGGGCGIAESFQEKGRYCTEGHSLVGMVGMG